MTAGSVTVSRNISIILGIPTLKTKRKGEDEEEEGNSVAEWEHNDFLEQGVWLD